MTDPLSTGASVVAFLGVAWSSAKAIHEILSAIKDGPQIVQHLAGEVEQLQGILKRIKDLVLDPTNNSDFADLVPLSTRCKTDLAMFSSKLERLHLTQNDRRIGKLWKRLKAAINEKELERMRNTVRDHISVLSLQLTLQTTERMSVSTTQSCQILVLLQQIQTEFRGSLFMDSMSHDKTTSLGAASQGTARATYQPGAELEQSFDGLIQLIKGKDCSLDFDDAEQLISNLQTLLESAQQKELSSASLGRLTTPTRANIGWRTTDVSKEIKLVSNLLHSSPSISINHDEAGTPAVSAAGGIVIGQDDRRKVIDIGIGTLTVTTIRRRRVHSGEDGEDRSTSGTLDSRDFKAEVIFRPNRSSARVALTVSQGQLPRGSFLTIPRITYGNIVPADSEVFGIASDGTIDDLVSFLAQGRASIHDRNPLGWSLLHSAARADNVPMVKFLIQNGLDIDEICLHDNKVSEVTPLHFARMHESSKEVLLEAGADPTLRVEYNGSVLNAVFALVPLDIAVTPDFITHVNLMYRHSRHFGLSASRDLWGRTPFLSHIDDYFGRNHEWVEPSLLINLYSDFLRNGCNINDRDYGGFNCLHIVFHCCPPPTWVSIRDRLVYLVGKGADVYAEDILGRTVSQFAYSRTCQSEYSELGSYRGDLWDVVLDTCGFSVSGFRKGFPRKATYTDCYSREDFEKLWEGREDRCPYWNESEWRSPEDTEEDSEQQPGGDEICVCPVWRSWDGEKVQYSPNCHYEPGQRWYMNPFSSSEEGSTVTDDDEQLENDVDPQVDDHEVFSHRAWEEHTSESVDMEEQVHDEMDPAEDTSRPPPIDAELSHNPWDEDNF